MSRRLPRPPSEGERVQGATFETPLGPVDFEIVRAPPPKRSGYVIAMSEQVIKQLHDRVVIAEEEAALLVELVAMYDIARFDKPFVHLGGGGGSREVSRLEAIRGVVEGERITAGERKIHESQSARLARMNGIYRDHLALAGVDVVELDERIEAGDIDAVLPVSVVEKGEAMGVRLSAAEATASYREDAAADDDEAGPNAGNTP